MIQQLNILYAHIKATIIIIILLTAQTATAYVHTIMTYKHINIDSKRDKRAN